jgi:hypothetical protein
VTASIVTFQKVGGERAFKVCWTWEVSPREIEEIRCLYCDLSSVAWRAEL